MGYQHETYGQWASNNIDATCIDCKEAINPRSPKSIRCDTCQRLAEHEKWKESLSRDLWIQKVLGITVEAFIATYGLGAYQAIDKKEEPL